MTAPVDVLAVYDDCIAKLEYHYRSTRAGDEMREARAAVAELIAADREYDAAWEAMRFDQGTECGDNFNAAKARRAAALARVGGGK